MLRYALTGWLAAAAGALVLGCGSSAPTTGERPLVVATTTQVADMTRNVAGSAASVVQLLQPNTDAHSFEPTSDQLSDIAKATLIVANGAGLDDWITRLRESAGAGAPIVTATRDITPLSGPDGRDPHVWMDPANAILMVGAIRDGLIEADPGNAQRYRTNATRYIATLKALDTELAALIRRVPAQRRRIVTDHDAFAYLARRYAITVVGAAIPTRAGGSEPNARELATLAKLIRREGVRVVFPEAALNPTIARALADEAGVRVGPTLYADSLGPAGSGASTYVAMMRANVQALVDGMNGG